MRSPTTRLGPDGLASQGAASGVRTTAEGVSAMTTMTDVHVLIGHEGEWSSLIVWVAGVFTNEKTAREVAEDMKRRDRANHVTWDAWNKEFWAQGHARGLTWDSHTQSWAGLGTRSEAAVAIGLSVEPERGTTDSEYFVSCVPLDTCGRWDYE